MNGAAISLGLFLTLALVAYIAWPWWAQRGGWKPVKPAQKMQREALLERREAILITLRDLEFDYSVAKVTKDDYESLRRPLLIEVADIITQLDEEQAKAEAELYTRIEQDVLALHQTLAGNRDDQEASSNGACPACGWLRRPGAFYCVKCGSELPALCPECGQATEPTDAFCRACGTELASSFQQQLAQQ